MTGEMKSGVRWHCPDHKTCNCSPSDTPASDRVSEAREQIVTLALIGPESASGIRSLVDALIAAVREEERAQSKAREAETLACAQGLQTVTQAAAKEAARLAIDSAITNTLARVREKVEAMPTSKFTINYTGMAVGTAEIVHIDRDQLLAALDALEREPTNPGTSARLLADLVERPYEEVPDGD